MILLTAAIVGIVFGAVLSECVTFCAIVRHARIVVRQAAPSPRQARTEAHHASS